MFDWEVQAEVPKAKGCQAQAILSDLSFFLVLPVLITLTLIRRK